MYLCYSENINLKKEKFLQYLFESAKSRHNLLLNNNRIFYNNTFYKITVVFFSHNKQLGYFNPSFCEIGVHIGLRDEDAYDVLDHELAHFVAWIKYNSLDHGMFFKKVCDEASISKHLQGYAIAVDLNKPPRNLTSKQETIRKLLRLSQSSSPHEAASALSKAYKLARMYNLEDVDNYDSTQMSYVARVIIGKRKTPLVVIIAQFLKHYNVFPVFHIGLNGYVLELIGSIHSIEYGEYVTKYLQEALPHLLKQHQNKNGHKATAHTKSFYRGVYDGFIERNKMESTKEETSHCTKLQRALNTHVQMVYTRVSTQKSQTNLSSSYSSGLSAGHAFSIHQPLKSNQKSIGFFAS